jgi:hypothetical protein
VQRENVPSARASTGPACCDDQAKGESPIDGATGLVEWPMVGNPLEVQLEAVVDPKESETYEFDFIIPRICVT